MKNLIQKIILGLLAIAILVTVLSRKSYDAKATKAEALATPEITVTPEVSATPLVTATPTAEPTNTPEPTAEPVEETFEISMIGDLTLSASKDKLSWGIGYQLTVGDDYAYPTRNVKQYLENDYLTIGNLECNLSDDWQSLQSPTYEQFVFCAKTEYAQILTEGSIEFVTLANNHTNDFGSTGYEDTEAALDKYQVAYAGEDEIYIYEADGGLKVGLYCIYNQLTGNALSTKSEAEQAALVSASKTRLEEGFKKLQEAGAEYCIACLHMGTEGYYEPSEVQTEMCHFTIDAGYNAVYCTHAHRLQPAELYNDGIIFYGLGNFSFGGHTNPGNDTDAGSYDTGIAKIVVKRYGDQITLDSYDFIPCSISSTTGVNNYQPTPYEEGSDQYNRTMSLLSGTYEGANYSVGNYWDLLARMG